MHDMITEARRIEATYTHPHAHIWPLTASHSFAPLQRRRERDGVKYVRPGKEKRCAISVHAVENSCARSPARATGHRKQRAYRMTSSVSDVNVQEARLVLIGPWLELPPEIELSPFRGGGGAVNQSKMGVTDRCGVVKRG